MPSLHPHLTPVNTKKPMLEDAALCNKVALSVLRRCLGIKQGADVFCIKLTGPYLHIYSLR